MPPENDVSGVSVLFMFFRMYNEPIRFILEFQSVSEFLCLCSLYLFVVHHDICQVNLSGYKESTFSFIFPASSLFYDETIIDGTLTLTFMP